MIRKFRRGPLSFSSYAERLMACVACAWGLWIFSFQSVAFVPVYQELGRFLPSWFISVYFVTCGLVLLILADPGYRKFPHAALFSGWLTVSISFFWFDIRNTGGIAYLTFSLLHVGLYLRAHVIELTTAAKKLEDGKLETKS